MGYLYLYVYCIWTLACGRNSEWTFRIYISMGYYCQRNSSSQFLSFHIQYCASSSISSSTFMVSCIQIRLETQRKGRWKDVASLDQYSSNPGAFVASHNVSCPIFLSFQVGHFQRVGITSCPSGDRHNSRRIHAQCSCQFFH